MIEDEEWIMQCSRDERERRTAIRDTAAALRPEVA
jgi:hypothetical protein